MSQDPKTAVNDSVLSQDLTYKALLDQQMSIESQYATESSRYTDQNPMMQELQERRAKIKQLLREHILRVIGPEKSPAADKSLISGSIQQDLSTQLLQTQINLSTQKKLLNDLRKQAIQANSDFQKIVQLQQRNRKNQKIQIACCKSLIT